MKNDDINEPAFPVAGALGANQFNGMTLRDYFAKAAMHQFLAGAVIPNGYNATEEFANLAIRAYEMADAMLKERSK